jgi:hypothetical protein
VEGWRGGRTVCSEHCLISCLCMFSDGNLKPRKRRKYSEGLGDSVKYKTNGVKKVLVLVVAPGVKEEQKTVEDFLQRLNFKRNSVQFTPDLKVTNILCGIGRHSSKQPSAFCNWEKGNLERCTDADLRTFQGIRKMHAAWLEAGGKKDEVKHFLNCVGVPVSSLPKYGRVIDHIVLVALHIKMGVVNKMITGLEKDFPLAKEWPAKLHLVREDYFHKFEGKFCFSR